MEQDMEYIYQVYRDQSFSKAAENLFMTQPALSLAIRRVEDRLGAGLFDRSRRPLRLTQAGEAYIAAIDRIRQLEKGLVQEIEDLRNLETGTLRIGGTHFLNSYVLAPLAVGFSQRYPGIHLEFAETSSDRLPPLLKNHDVDLILSCAPDAVEQFDHRLAFQDHILLAVPQTFPLAEPALHAALSGEDIIAARHLRPDCPKASFSWFQDLDFLLLTPGNNLRKRSAEFFSQAGFVPKIKMELSQLVTAYRLASCGMGCTFTSDHLVRTFSSGLRFFRLRDLHMDRTFFVLLSKQNYTPFALRAFLQYAEGRNWNGWTE